MIRLIVSALWICAITLVSSYVAASWKARGTMTAGPEENLVGLNYQKTDPINVPIISDGAIDGYVVAQFVYTADASTLNHLSVPPDPFILDEAFRAIFSDESIDVAHLERFDIKALTDKMRTDVNARFGTDLVEDVLVEQFTFISKEEVLAQAGAKSGGPVIVADEAAAERDKAEAGAKPGAKAGAKAGTAGAHGAPAGH